MHTLRRRPRRAAVSFAAALAAPFAAPLAAAGLLWLSAAAPACAAGFNPPPPDLIQTGGSATLDGAGVSGDSQFLFFSAASRPTFTQFGQVVLYADSAMTVGAGGSVDTLDVLGTSTATLSGGTVSEINAYESSVITITGGLIGGPTSQRFPGLLFTSGTGVIDLFGTNLSNVNGLVTGTLADGTSITTRYSGAGQLLFNGALPGAVPETSTSVSFALLLGLGLGGLMVATRRRKV